MGKFKKTKKIQKLKTIVNPSDSRLKANQNQEQNTMQKFRGREKKSVQQIEVMDTNLFFRYNENLVPPYNILLDTNFIHSSIQYKLDIMKGCSELLLAKCNMFVTDCIISELEKLGPKYSLALKLAKDARFKKLTCTHKGTYADDCIVNRVKENRCYIVATNDRDLKRRLRKITGVPILYANNHKFRIERLPDNIFV